MHPPEYNLKLAHAMLEEMEPFLFSSEIFWPLSQPSQSIAAPFPRLTLGGLFLTLDQLIAQEAMMSTEQAAELDIIHQGIEHLRHQWPAGLERKAVGEQRNRLNLWRAYLTDLEERSERPHNFKHEVRHRVMFQRLIDLAAKHSESDILDGEMRGLDTRLQSFFKPGAFIWDEALQEIYSSDSFWYLYGVPR